MRVPGAYATAVRDPEGNIQIDRHDFKSKVEIYPFLKKPLLRGIIGLFESLKIGYSTLQWSAEISIPEEEGKKEPSKFVDVLLTLFSFGLALGLFFVAPIGLTSWLFDKDQDAFIFNLISGLFRVIFFLTYLVLISLMKDVRRLFQYHGAEHKTVYNFESGQELSIANAQKFSTLHPRCGTSFIFIIMIVTIFSYAVLDSIALLFVDSLNFFIRLTIHLICLPLVAGIGYEVLKFLSTKQHILIFQFLSKPGLLLQNITTKQPDNEQVEVAIHALKSAFGKKIDDFSGKKFTAESIG